MNTFIYPIKDTYISSEYKTKNFGLDEILELKAKNKGKRLVTQKGYRWVLIPDSEATPAKSGDVAFDEENNGFYSYNFVPSGSAKWVYIQLPEGIAPINTHFYQFTGDLYTSGSVNVYLSGSCDYISGYFTGSIVTDSYVNLSGMGTTGSFTGTIYSGAEFETLVVNDVLYQSPLAEDITGTGYFEKFTGSLSGQFVTGRGNLCFGEGYFQGTIEAENFKGIIDNNLGEGRFTVRNTDLFVQGGYSGSIDPTGLPIWVIDTPNMSRLLLYFNLDDIFTAIQDGDIESPEYRLRLIACSQTNIPFNYKLFAFPISQSWDGGNGRLYFDEESTSGVSWLYRDYIDGEKWFDYDLESSWRSVDYFNNSGYATESFIHGGGTWYSDSEYKCTQSFDRTSQGDININVTPIVNSWNNKTIPNEGIILMLSNEVIESNKTLYANTNLQFYSRETNTIYSPALQVSWDDSVFNTGSLSPVDANTDILVNMPNIKETYKSGEVIKFIVFSRKKYQLKQFNKAYQQPNMVTPQYLPEETYYMLKDAESEMVIYDYSKFTKVSCDEDGNYFIFDMTGLPQERYYRFYIKSKFNNGTVRVFDTEKIFKVVR